jgi:hypothetical protein
VLGRPVLGGADGLAWRRRRGQVGDRGRRAGQHGYGAEPAHNRGEAAARAELTAAGHDLGHVDRVGWVARRPERLAQRRGV